MIKVGQKLHDARINKSISLDEIASATKIRPRFLTAIERGEFDKLPSSAYARGFVTNYASYLGLSQKEILALFRREFDEKKPIKVLPESMTTNTSFSINRIHIQQSFIILAIILLTLAGYLAFQYRSFFVPPQLNIITPKVNTLSTNNITISGQTDPYATVYINNETVALNSDGKFSKNLALFPGQSTISIKARNRFGRETEIEKKVNVTE